MTIEVTSTVPDYDPTTIDARYVRYDGAGVYKWCETFFPNPRRCVRYDARQGTCAVDDLPPAVAMAAIARHNEGIWPSYVDWPLSIVQV